MARFRTIDVRIWGDKKFRALSPPQPNAQTLWFYLLTGEHTGPLPGLFSVGEQGLAESLRWPLKALRRCWDEIAEQKMAAADWEARVVWLPNRIKYAEPANANVVKSWQAAWDEIPECSLKTEAWNAYYAYMEERDCKAQARAQAKGEADPGFVFTETFLRACPDPSGVHLPNSTVNGSRNGMANRSRNGMPNQDQEQEQEQDQEQDQERPPRGASVARSGDAGERRRKPAAPKAGGKPHPIRDALTVFDELFTGRTGEHPDITAAHCKLLKGLIGRHGLAAVIAKIRAMFSSTDPFIAQSGYTIGVLSSCWNKLAVQAHAPPVSSVTVQNLRAANAVLARIKGVAGGES